MLVGKMRNADPWVLQIANELAGRDQALLGFAIFENGEDVAEKTDEMELAVKGIAGRYFTFQYTRTGTQLKEITPNADLEYSQIYTLIFA